MKEQSNRTTLYVWDHFTLWAQEMIPMLDVSETIVEWIMLVELRNVGQEKGKELNRGTPNHLAISNVSLLTVTYYWPSLSFTQASSWSCIDHLDSGP